jgi:hypothetical protein
MSAPLACCHLECLLSLTRPFWMPLQEERTQGRNRERAMAILRAKVFELELEKQRRCASGLSCCPDPLWCSEPASCIQRCRTPACVAESTAAPVALQRV